VLTLPKTSTLPRFINPASIDVGDVIRVSWRAGGVEHARTARVHRRVDEGATSVFFTEEGYEIFHWVPGVNHVRVTLIEVAKRQPSTLTIFDFVEITG